MSHPQDVALLDEYSDNDDDDAYDDGNTDENYHDTYEDPADDDLADDNDPSDGAEEMLFRCVALFKGGICCREVFECEDDVIHHLRITHKTSKMLYQIFTLSVPHNG